MLVNYGPPGLWGRVDAGVGGGVWFGVLVVGEHAYEQLRIVFIAALLIRSPKLVGLMYTFILILNE